jgi:DNA mismatch repair protein MutS2
MQPSTKSIHDLEWPALTALLASRCQSVQAQLRARELSPSETLDEARERMRRTEEALRASRDGDPIPTGPLPDVTDVLLRIDRVAEVTSLELHQLREAMRTAHTLRRWSQSRRVAFPALAAALHSDPALDRLLSTLDLAIDPDGTLADRASADLARCRRQVHDMRGRVVQRLEEFMAKYAAVLQDRFYTLRDGRYVLPVRSDSHIRVPGIVHGSSGSGATLFIEPRPVVLLGNQLKVLTAEMEREEARVLMELAERCRGEIRGLEEAHEACVAADLLGAIVALADDLKAIAVEPESEPVLDLRRARHPLLALSPAGAVPNDLSLRAGRVLVVSGPNAGGKTVALKTLGLAAMMVRAGLALPVQEGSRVGWFDPVFCDVGDDQSLARNLSTFSAHVSNLADVLRGVRPGSLVLLDELAGGTDPEEGSALAAAVLETLAARGAAVAVTTHYELLKTLAVRDERFVNASVGFDLATMAPTFAVTMGVPGASSALAVAQRFGVPSDVVERARGLLPEHAGSREDVLRRLQDEERATRLARSAAEDESRAITALRVELEAEKHSLRVKERERLSREGSELVGLLRRAREELRDVQAKLRRKKVGEEDVREAERAVNEVAKLASIDGALGRGLEALKPAGAGRRQVREEELRPGMKVYVPRLGNTVEVLEAPSRGQLRVAAGALKLMVAVDEVQLDAGDEPVAAEAGRGRAPTAAASASPGELERVLRLESNTCDVRGLRADDALGMVDTFLDRVLGQGSTTGYVLHGHGTGALKLAVREHLKRSPWVRASRAADPEDGGDAFTAFWLKG